MQTNQIKQFARAYVLKGGWKLWAVLGLEMLLKSIKGIGLLLILPLLGLLGLGAEPGTNHVWSKLVGGLEAVGIALTLENGLVLFVSVIVSRAFLDWRRATWQVEVEQRFQMSLRTHLYEVLANTEMHFLQRLRSSEFLQSTQIEIRNTQRAANSLLLVFSDGLNLAIYFAVALILSWQMTVFVFISGGISMVLLYPFVRKTHTVSSRQVRNTSKMLNNVLEHIQGVRIARTLGLTGKFIDDFRARCREAAAMSRRLRGLAAQSLLLFEVISVTLLATIAYLALTRFEVEAARLVVVLLIFVRIFPSIGIFQNRIQQFVSHVPSFQHYQMLLEKLKSHQEVAPEAEEGPELKLRDSLQVRNVSFSYHRSGSPALRNVSLVIKRGALNVVCGRSGAGKSTLADILTGLLPAQVGELILDGKPLSATDRVRWRKETAIVPQEGFLFNDTVRANLKCVRPDASESEILNALEAVNADKAFMAKPDGLDTVVGERGCLLSGGERQRLSIARALLRRPQLLVLDEPTNNLDQQSEESLLKILDSLKKQTTLIVITHNKKLSQLADRAFDLEDGALVPAGPASVEQETVS